ncbi:MAG: glycosyltransferase [Candidatus Omnitrophica bacterium]|nr:glycosyltransferase [Candidatus Omnitrophota bacterium]
MSDTPVCDLVLLSWNHLEETRPCLETLFASTGVPCRLLIVDNGSEPEVRAFLRTVTPRGHITEVTLLQNEQNEGFPKGMNRGIQASTAPFVCLLNNDLLFTKGWLEELIDVAGTHREIGVVNPSSSTLGNRPSRGQPQAAPWRLHGSGDVHRLLHTHQAGGHRSDRRLERGGGTGVL